MTDREKLLTDDPTSIASRYKNAKKTFDTKLTEKYLCRYLTKYYDKFKGLLGEFSETYANLFKEFVDQQFNISNCDTKNYLDLSSAYISEIQNIYLNPINYILTKRKANWSIRLGFVSIILAILTIVYPDIFKNFLSHKVSTEQSPKIECCCPNDTICSVEKR